MSKKAQRNAQANATKISDAVAATELANDPSVAEIAELMDTPPNPAKDMEEQGVKTPEVFQAVNLNKIRLKFEVDVSDGTDKDAAPVFESRDYAITDLIQNSIGLETDLNRVTRAAREVSAMVMSLAKQFPSVGQFGAVCSQIEEQAKWGRVPAGTPKGIAAQYRPLPQTYKNAKSICKMALEDNIVPFIAKTVPCKPTDTKTQVIDHKKLPLNTFNQLKEAVSWTKKARELAKESETKRDGQAEANRHAAESPETKQIYVHQDLITVFAKLSKAYEKGDGEFQTSLSAALEDIRNEYCK